SHTVADLRRPLHPCVLSGRDPRTSNRRGPKAGSLHRRLYFGTALQATADGRWGNDVALMATGLAVAAGDAGHGRGRAVLACARGPRACGAGCALGPAVRRAGAAAGGAAGRGPRDAHHWRSGAGHDAAVLGGDVVRAGAGAGPGGRRLHGSAAADAPHRGAAGCGGVAVRICGRRIRRRRAGPAVEQSAADARPGCGVRGGPRSWLAVARTATETGGRRVLTQPGSESKASLARARAGKSQPSFPRKRESRDFRTRWLAVTGSPLARG